MCLNSTTNLVKICSVKLYYIFRQFDGYDRASRSIPIIYTKCVIIDHSNIIKNFNFSFLIRYFFGGRSLQLNIITNLWVRLLILYVISGSGTLCIWSTLIIKSNSTVSELFFRTLRPIFSVVMIYHAVCTSNCAKGRTLLI